MRLNIKHIIISLLFLCGLGKSYGQQLPQFSQYMYNTIVVNPAYAGSKETINFMALHRSQWVGIKGAPVTQFASVHAPLTEKNLGGGISFVNDRLGYESSSYIYGDLSYTIRTSYSTLLSFGIKAGTSHYSLDDELLNDPEIIQDAFFNDKLSYWNFNVGAGIFLRGESWYFGFAVPRFKNHDNNRSPYYKSLERVNYFVNGGVVHKVSPWLTVKPTVMVKMTNGAPVSVDATINALFGEGLWLGVTYRHKDALGAIGSFNITDELSIGYAYEYSTTPLAGYSFGSHELLLTYNLKYRDNCRCPDLY